MQEQQQLEVTTQHSRWTLEIMAYKINFKQQFKDKLPWLPCAHSGKKREAALPRRRRLGTQVDLKVLKSTCPSYQKMIQYHNAVTHVSRICWIPDRRHRASALYNIISRASPFLLNIKSWKQNMICMFQMLRNGLTMHWILGHLLSPWLPV